MFPRQFIKRKNRKQGNRCIRVSVRNQSIAFTKTRWSFDRVILNGVNIDIETTPFTLKGTILFRDNDPVYGDGIFGSLDLSIKKILEDPVGITVGFGSMEDYRYFFLDAKIPARYIIPGTPIGLSRIIGGIYYHMSPNKTTENDLLSLTQNFGNVSGNALSYIPDPNTALGLKMGVTGEFIFNESAANGDFLLDIRFTNSGGLGSVCLTGNAYSMASIAKRINAPIKGRIILMYDAQNKVF